MFRKFFGSNKQSKRKKEIWLSPLTKTPTPTENSKTNRQHKNATKKLRLHNDCGPTLDGQLE